MTWDGNDKYAKPSLEIIRNATLAPLTFLNRAKTPNSRNFDGGVYYPGGEICQLGLQVKGGYSNTPTETVEPVENLPGRHVFGGMLQNWHFGHFMTESLSRLWAVREIANVDSVVFYRRHPNVPRLPKWIADTLRMILGEIPVTIISAPTRIETLIVPSQIAHTNGMIYGHPLARDMFRLAYKDEVDQPKRLYVSRAGLSGKQGGLVCEDILEQNLAKAGYAIMRPERASIEAQIHAYRGADDIIFAEGSAIHFYAMVAKPGQNLFCVWRRNPCPMILSWQVKTFGGSNMHGKPCISHLYIPKKDGKDQVHGRAVLDFDNLRSQLTAKKFLKDSEWQNPSPEDIEKEISEIGDYNIISFN